MKKLLPIIGILTLLLAVSVSCKKKHVQPEAPVQEVSKFDLIKGDYKVYDTLGNYLYAMEIIHKQDVGEDGYRRDSLEFINFDGQFHFKTEQSNANITNWPKDYLYVGDFDPILDSNQNRFFFFGYSTALINDTITFKFKKDNIQYYLFDMVPYYKCICKQIAVKQH